MNYYERFSKQMAWYGHPVDKEKTSNLVKIKTRIKRRDQANCHVSTHPEVLNKKDALKNFPKFACKHQRRNIFK